MNNVKAILFDLDGTLTDSGQGIMNCYAYAIEKMGLPVPSQEVLRTFVGPPLVKNLGSIMPEEQIDEAYKHYRYRMIEQNMGIIENEVYEGVESMLRAVKDAGYAIYTATSKPEFLAEKVLAHFNLNGYFDAIYGASNDGKTAGKAWVVGRVINENNLNPQETVMIGDRHHDVDGAKEHGINTIGVAWGYGSEEELMSAGAIAYVQKPEDILKAISDT